MILLVPFFKSALTTDFLSVFKLQTGKNVTHLNLNSPETTHI